MSLVRRGNGDITDRYRPRKFGEIVGNDANVKVLKGMLKEGDQRGKSGFFCGSKGSGKTTSARIMAMALNCEKGDVDPCLECDECKAALNGNAMHITEMNMSQFNTKEEMENLVNGMYFSTLTGRNKVYLLDEMQSVSVQAQNLFLKNLEEPPQNTYIFLCTTESKKIIGPLRDRCYHLEFKYPGREDLVLVLKSVMEQEGWSMSDEDKGKFFEFCVGLSIREVLKALDQAVKGGVDTLVEFMFEKAEYIEVCRCIVASDFKSICNKLKILETNKELDAELLRCAIMGYLKSILVSKGMTAEGVRIFETMKIFSNQYFEAKPIPRLYRDCFEACIMMGQK